MQPGYRTLIGILYTAGFMMFFCGCKNNNNSQSEKETDARVKSRSLTVFAAASLTGVLSEIADSFETRYQADVKLNLASSGTLVRQMEQGADPGVFISASREWANYADSAGLVLKEHQAVVARNELVLIAPAGYRLKERSVDSTLNLQEMLGEGRISLGDPRHVPAGRYAKEALEYYGLYSQVRNRIIPANDVRSALMLVELNEAPLGIVYRTDVLKSTKVVVLAPFPEKSHAPIVYVAGVCSNDPLAKDFFDYLQSDQAKRTWKKYGFKE